MHICRSAVHTRSRFEPSAPWKCEEAHSLAFTLLLAHSNSCRGGRCQQALRACLYENERQGKRGGRGIVHASLQGMQRPVLIAVQQAPICSLLLL